MANIKYFFLTQGGICTTVEGEERDQGVMMKSFAQIVCGKSRGAF